LKFRKLSFGTTFAIIGYFLATIIIRHGLLSRTEYQALKNFENMPRPSIPFLHIKIGNSIGDKEYHITISKSQSSKVKAKLFQNPPQHILETTSLSSSKSRT